MINTRPHPRPRTLAGILITLAVAAPLAACGDDTPVVRGAAPATDPSEPVSEPVGEGVDVGEPSPDMFPTDAARADATALIGVAEPDLELDDMLRIGRRGDEHFALIEDYRLGRITVELDEVDGTFVVTAATVELPDGPETITADTAVDPAAPLDEDAARAEAAALLGVAEEHLEVGDTLRIARRGSDEAILTMDFRPGRITVELDDVDGIYVVTAATVELAETTETITAP